MNPKGEIETGALKHGDYFFNHREVYQYLSPLYKAKESDLYLGDISIIDGNSVAIKSWEKAVLGNVREFESNSNDIFDIIMRELENDK